MKIKVQVQGVHALDKKMRFHALRSQAGLRKGLFRAGLFLQRESQKIVPIDTNVLRASARTRIEGTGFFVNAIVSYGTDYAIYVHENLEARHKPGKSAKYLEKPLREKRDRINEIIAEGIKGELP